MDVGESAALPYRRLGVVRTADAADGWYERDVRGVELRSVSTHFGVETARVEVLLGPLLALECPRLQIQPLMEQAWTRLQTLRERLVDVRVAASVPAIAKAMERAEDALRTPCATTLTTVEEQLAGAFDACNSASTHNKEAANVRALQALAAAASFDFSQAIVRSEQAAALSESFAQRWQHRVLHAELLLDQGREFNDVESLKTLQKLCEESLLPMVPADKMPAERAWVYDCLGQTLGILGRRQSFTATLEQAVEAFEAALALRDRTASPFDWATTQNHLGNAIGSLGQRQHSLELLDRAAAAFEAALEVPISNAAPEGRASAQSNLAAVLQTIGQQRQDAATIARAVTAYKAALSIWTPDRKPLFWAATQSNFGAALRVLGGMEKDSAMLEQSVAAYRAALKARTRERMPHEWAMTQNDLGAALQAVGEQKEDALTFGRAIAAYREALKEISRDGEPMTWAMTMANIGVARRKLAEYTYDVDASRRSVGDIQMALDVFRGAKHARLTELGLEQLAIAMEVHAELTAEASD
ncbi:MAG: tetratricopeptide repeat protein [Chromatiales bacterium]|nr:tetratricopeptide repeat protein [Chromatiales bacterium]